MKCVFHVFIGKQSSFSSVVKQHKKTPHRQQYDTYKKFGREMPEMTILNLIPKI